MKDAVEADKKAFQLVVEGKCDSPIRTNIQAPKYDGSFLFMPAYVEEMDTASLKVVNIFPHNIDRGLPSSPAQVFLIDGTTGIVEAVLDGTAQGAGVDLLVARNAVETNQKLTVQMSLELGTEELAVAVARSSDLTAKINQALTALQQEGVLDDLAAQYGLTEELIAG